MKRPTRPASNRLGDVKGGDILAQLKAQMRPEPDVGSSHSMPHAPDAALRKKPSKAKKRKPKHGGKTKASGAAKAAKQPAKTILKLPKSLVEEAYLSVGGQASRYTQSTQPKPVSDFGEAAFHRLRRLQVSLTGFTADHRAPFACSDASRTLVAGRISLAASLIGSVVDQSADGYIGYDFGTSATKAVVRWPFDSSRDDYAIPVPADCTSGGVAHLWPTAVYFEPVRKHFSLLPGAGTFQLQGFKGALIEQQGHRMCQGSGATMAAAATAFLTLHLAYVIGTILDRDSAARISGVNLAVPVASLNDRADCPHFDNVVRAAILLIPKAPQLALVDVEAALASSKAGALPHDLHAELSGAIAGYCRSPRRFEGSHMIIDCGSATLDIASFKLGTENYPIGIYSAGVELLGADACRIYVANGGLPSDCRDAARFHEHEVYKRALRASFSFAQNEQRKYPYQVILIGGGIENEFYGSMLERFQDSFSRPFHKPQLDPRLQCESAAQPGRLILADGLARNPIDLRKVLMPAPPEREQPHLNPNYHDWTSN